MKKILSSIAIIVTLLASSPSFAVHLVCYNAAAPNDIGCWSYLVSYEVNNGHNGVAIQVDGSMACGGGDADGIFEKPTNTTTAAGRGHRSPTCSGDVITVWSAQVHGWDGLVQGDYDYVDWDTMDEDIAGAGYELRIHQTAPLGAVLGTVRRNFFAGCSKAGS